MELFDEEKKAIEIEICWKKLASALLAVAEQVIEEERQEKERRKAFGEEDQNPETDPAYCSDPCRSSCNQLQDPITRP